MSDTDTRPLWRIWRDAEGAALGGIEPADLDQVDAICDEARIEALRSWLFPGAPASPWDSGIWQRLTVEIERCKARMHTTTGDSDA
jgi:hypothetical protein